MFGVWSFRIGGDIVWIIVIVYRILGAQIQKPLKDYLNVRGVNDELAVFLHEYMMNKDRTELIRWFGDVKTFVEL